MRFILLFPLLDILHSCITHMQVCKYRNICCSAILHLFAHLSRYLLYSAYFEWLASQLLPCRETGHDECGGILEPLPQWLGGLLRGHQSLCR